MAKKPLPIVEISIDKIVGGGQAIGVLEDGRKMFVWGALPGEKVRAQMTKKKSSYAEGVAIEILENTSPDRVEPVDPGSYLSTSPWQIMSLEAEQRYKAQLIDEAFELHGVKLLDESTIYSDGVQYGYRNKVEFSFWFDTETEKLSLAFFRRGTHGKISVEGTSLAAPVINATAKEVLEDLNRQNITGREVKTLLIRCSQGGDVAWQLYVKDETFPVSAFTELLLKYPKSEIIYSNPKSPASVITERLTPEVWPLDDSLRDINFKYATEGFFQINLPVYERALADMEPWTQKYGKCVDFYSGVGTIGLTIGGPDITLVEVNENAVREMKRNILELKKPATAVLAASENALEYISSDNTVIVDPPRAGLHEAVVDKLLEVTPPRIIYLSCNPVTQARDVSMLLDKYKIVHNKGYNFFPRTPHIENLVVLDVA